MHKANKIDIDLVRKLYTYDCETGVLISRRTSRPIRSRKGDYLTCKVQGRHIAAHRVIWAMHHGEDPGEMFVDHIDRDCLNNRISNLRLLNNQDNGLNNCGLGINRVGNRWRAAYRRGGEYIHLGMHDCPLLAGMIVRDHKTAVLN